MSARVWLSLSIALMLSDCGDGSAAPAVTWAQYQAIHDGMSIAEVRTLLRQQGHQLAGQDIGGVMVRTYEFGPGGQALIQFDGDKVISKSTVTIQPPPP